MHPGQTYDHQWIRFANEDDLDSIMEIERLCFGGQWSRQQFASALKELFFVYDQKGILGFLVACSCDIAKRAIIMRIAVHPEHQGRGIASQLIDAGLDIIKAMDLNCVELDVDIVKNGAIKLYEKFGFKVMRVATVNYDEETSFFIMKLLLNKSKDAK
jgi:[ribosomal protein S18]-alanine N-acetyltransferase